MPTICHRSRFEMVGTLPPSLIELRRDKSLCPPCEPLLAPVVLSSCGNMIPLASWRLNLSGETMVKTVLVMATITIIACAAVIAIHELLVRARHPQVGPPPRRRAF